MTDLFHIKDQLTSDSATGDGVNRLVWLTVRVVMAVTTFGFFARFGAGLTSWAVGDMIAPFVSGALGVLMIDVLAYRWNSARLTASTLPQINIATWAMYMDLALSTGTTIVFVVFATSFLIPSGELLTALNLMGLAVGTLAFVGNFFGVAAYESHAAETQAAMQSARLRAMQQKGQFEIDQAHTIEVVARTIEEATRQIPDQAQSEAQRKAIEYFRTPGQEVTRVPFEQNGSK